MANTAQGLDVGSMALQGFGQVMDSMELVKRAWSNFSLATPFTPTVSVEELDKRIAELRAVEQWLTLNQTLLRNTIQGLEVQRGTLDAISTMSKSFGEMAKPADEALARFAAAAAHKAASPAEAARGANAPAAGGGIDWSPFAMPSSVFNRPPAGAPSGAAMGGAPAGDADEGLRARAAAEAGAEAEADDQAEPETEPEAEADVRESPAAGAADAKSAEPQPGMNPMAWWDMLQANFRQIAEAATAQQAGAAPATGAARSPQADRETRQADGSKRTSGRKAATGKATKPGNASGGKAKTGKTGTSGKTAAAPRRRKAGTQEPE